MAEQSKVPLSFHLHLTGTQEESQFNEWFTFIRFKSINGYPIGERNIGGNYTFAGDEIVPDTREPSHLNIKGPRFDAAIWGYTMPVNKGLNLFDENDRKILWVDTEKDLAEQLEDIELGIIHLIYPQRYEDLYETETTAFKDIVKMFAPFDNIKFVISNLCDVWGYEVNNINMVDYVSDILSALPPKRVFMFLANTEVVAEFKKRMPDAHIMYRSIYARRIYVNNRDFSNNTNHRKKHFLNLNNFEKPHRTEIVNFLTNNIPADKSYVSYVKKNLYLEEPHDLKNTHFTQWQYKFPHLYYTDSIINIVSETLFEYDWFVNDQVFEDRMLHKTHLSFFTEKSLKPIFFEQIFLIVGPFHVHKSLKTLGFKLFEDFIDYSFDDVKDHKIRMNMIKEQITRLSNIDINDLNNYYFSEECQNILKHNKEIFKQMRTFSINKYIKENSNG